MSELNYGLQNKKKSNVLHMERERLILQVKWPETIRRLCLINFENFSVCFIKF